MISEISTLSTQPGQSHALVPEVIHLVSPVAGEGLILVRKSAYGTVINLLQSLYIARPGDSESEIKQRVINGSTLPENLKLFGLQRETPTSGYTNLDSVDEKNALDARERLVQLLIRVLLHLWQSGCVELFVEPPVR